MANSRKKPVGGPAPEAGGARKRKAAKPSSSPTRKVAAKSRAKAAAGSAGAKPAKKKAAPRATPAAGPKRSATRTAAAKRAGTTARTRGPRGRVARARHAALSGPAPDRSAPPAQHEFRLGLWSPRRLAVCGPRPDPRVVVARPVAGHERGPRASTRDRRRDRLVLGDGYFHLSGEAYALVAIGLISFSAVAQFAPAMIGGLFWKGGTRLGALCGLSAGFLVWLYALLLPSFAKSGWLPITFLTEGIFGIDLLKPQQLFGLQSMDEISHCLFWSMIVNIGCYVDFSLWRRPTAAEHSQANLFVDVLRHVAAGSVSRFWRGSATVADLQILLGRFIGPERANESFASYARSQGVNGVEQLHANAVLVHYVESQIAGAIGSASARDMVASVVVEEPLALDEVMPIIDEASQALAYSRQLEQKSLELEAATNELRSANQRLHEGRRLCVER